MTTVILTRSEVGALLTVEMAVEAVERAFAAHGRGETLMPVKVYLPLPRYAGDFRAMPAFMDGSAGVKWVNAHPENPSRHGLPSVMGVYILSDPETALPLAIMDATLLTAMRTGAAAAVATRHLANPRPARLGLVGCGAQAPSLLAAHLTLYPDLEVVAADRVPEAAERFAASSSGGARVRAGSVAEAAACDVVCTATPSREPVVRREWLRPGVHINAMGADAPGKRELELAILEQARIVLDDREQASESGEVNVPLHRGELDRSAIHATLGEIVAGLATGRETAEEITVFDSTGLAVQDVALARVVYERARAESVGLEIDLVGLGS